MTLVAALNKSQLFTRRSLELQQELATKVRDQLKLDPISPVIIYDLDNIFNDSEIITIGSTRVMKKNITNIGIMYAVLSKAAQEVFNDINTYTQFSLNNKYYNNISYFPQIKCLGINSIFNNSLYSNSTKIRGYDRNGMPRIDLI